MVDQYVTYVGQVERGGLLDQGTAFVGDDHNGAPLVGFAALAAGQAPVLHAGQVLRQAAFLPAQPACEDEGPQAPFGRFGQVGQYLVVGHG